ncbi:tetratricopeptide (TPR) repeat protein [Kitasatospora sp. MAA4]|uniref:ATP-binding protein n=1 Tax=Kitasatospora sp. MAA4 TaxID=3035093 RepID=UPI00247627E7|nr:tetratricopeptide repeat protein [Kitasatospora sp. MAA4]MDH6135942.1 tetratricopeptide (TPR) repeat protein [Kitasatospora sp. MAA4]
MARSSDEPPHLESHSDLSGSAHDVVQAGNVHGGVHFHQGTDPGRPAPPRQLPGDVGSFVNRHNEIQALDAVLGSERGGDSGANGVYVITGTAGVGKTSLALHWAHGVRDRFPGGQLYVNLRGYDPGEPVTAEQALDHFLRALGVTPSSIPARLEDRSALFRSLLADQRALVILDNAATVSQVRPLLPGNPDCLVLVTSRHRFSGLVARDGAHRLTLDVFSERDAVRLLHTVTAEYRALPDTDTDLSELARLCARLPLALRIAAERASSRPLMPLNDLIADLRDESALWDALTAEEDDESDAVRTVFAWSYRALSEPAARLFRLLGLHPGPEFGASAAASLAGTTVPVARQLLDVLTGAHVLEQAAYGRFQFHDLLRIYAAQQAAQHEGEEARDSALARILSHYLFALARAISRMALLERPVPLPEPYPDVVVEEFTDRAAALQWFELERANVVSAVRTAAASGQHEVAWRIAALLRDVYMHRNPFQEWIAVSETGLASATAIGDRQGQAEMRDSLGKAYLQSQRLDEAELHHREALRLRRETGDRYGEGIAVNALGLVDWRRRRLATAEARFQEGREIFRGLADLRWEALLLSNLGMTRFDGLQLDAAAADLTEAVRLCQEAGDRANEGNALFYLSMTQRERGEPEAALSTIRQALDIARTDRLTAAGAFWLLELARIQRALGEPGEALVSCQESAVTQRQIGDRNREAAAHDCAGEAYRDLGRFTEAAGFHRMAVVTYRDTRDQWALANALVNLAPALSGAGDGEGAAGCAAEAAAVLSGFDDARATAQRERIAGLFP